MNKFIFNTKCKATPVQIAFMVNYMEEHPEVARGSASASLHDKLENEKHWEALTEELNALGGSIKTVTKWKQAWRDLKNNVKKKVVYKNTGRGAPTLKNISDVEEQVIAFMSPEVNTAVNTCTTVPETEVNTQNRALSISPFLKQEACSVSPVLSDPLQQVTLTTTTTTIAPPITTTKPRCIRRRRIARPIDSFESRMLRLREEKLAIKKEKNLLKREKLNLAKEKIGVLKRIADALEIMTDQLPK